MPSLCRLRAAAFRSRDERFLDRVAFVWCVRGGFDFNPVGRRPLHVPEGCFGVVYPGCFLSTALTGKSNELVYGQLGGANATRTFDRLGFRDGLAGRDSCPDELADALIGALEKADTPVARRNALNILKVLLSGTAARLRAHAADILFFDAMRVLHAGAPRPDFFAADACRELSVSRTTLDACLRRNGLSGPGAVLRELRLGRARELLTSTRLGVAEIGNRCGFSNAAHFSAFFRRRTGLAPLAFRGAGRSPKPYPALRDDA